MGRKVGLRRPLVDSRYCHSGVFAEGAFLRTDLLLEIDE